MLGQCPMLAGEVAALAVSLSEQTFIFETRKLALHEIPFELSDEANLVPGGCELDVRAGRERPTTSYRHAEVHVNGPRR